MVRHERGQRVTGGFRVIEIALEISLQPHRELVEVLRHLVVVVEVLDEIDLVIAVQVAQPGNLVAAAHVDGFIHDLHAERLKEAGGDAFPGQLPQIALNAADDPHVSVPRANRGAPAVLEKVEAAEAHPGVPRIRRVGRRREFIDRERAVFATQNAARGQRWVPARRPALSEWPEVGCRRRRECECRQRVGVYTWSRTGDEHFHIQRRGGGRDA